MKKEIKWMMILIVGMCMINVPAASMNVHASETEQEEEKTADTAIIKEIKQIMSAKKEAEVKTDPSAEEVTLMSFSSGDYVYVIGETANGWYLINYQNIVGYVEKSALGAVEVDLKELENEMNVSGENEESTAKESNFVIPQMNKNTKWIVAIAFLLGGVVVTGLLLALMTKLSSLGGGKKKKKSNNK